MGKSHRAKAAAESPRARRPSLATSWAEHPYRWLALAAVVVSGVFLGPLLTTSQYFFGSGSDIQSYQVPHRAFAFGWLRQGVWPLWNPFIFNGVPFQSGVHSLMYPLHALGLVFPVAVEIKLAIWTHLALGVFGLAGMAHWLGLEWLAAIVGGCVYALSGFAVAHLYAGHVDIVTTMAYTPLTLWAFLAAMRYRGAGYVAVAALSMVLATLTGHYQILYLTLFAAVGGTGLTVLLGSRFAVQPLDLRAPFATQAQDRAPPDDAAASHEWTTTGVTLAQRLTDAQWFLVRTGAIGVLAGLGTAMQLWPTNLSMALSNRAEGTDYAFATSEGVRPLNWLTTLAPDFFGGVLPAKFWPNWSPWEGQAYLGVAALALMLAALATNRRHATWVPAMLVLVASLLALGDDGPLYRLLYAVDPLLGRFRVPPRFLLVVTLMGSYLTAVGLHTLRTSTVRRADPQHRTRVLVAMGLLVGLCVVIWASLRGATPDGHGVWETWFRDARSTTKGDVDQPEAAFLKEVLQLATSKMLSALLLACASAAAVLVAVFVPNLRRMMGVLLALLVVVDLWSYAQPRLTTKDASYFELPAATVEYLKTHHPTQRMITAPAMRALNWGEVHGLSQMGGYDTLIGGDYNRAINAAFGKPADDKLMRMSNWSAGPLWNLQGVRYVATRGPIQALPPKMRTPPNSYTLAASEDGINLFENPQAFERAFVVRRVDVAADDAAVLTSLTTDDAAAKTRAFVTKEDAAALQTALASGSSAAGAGPDRVEVAPLTPNEVAVDVDLPSPGLLVVTDAWWPGWNATVDGAAASLLAVNARLHRGVVVPAGKHHVVMRYWPAGLTVGLAISLPVLALLLGYVGWGLRRRQQA